MAVGQATSLRTLRDQKGLSLTQVAGRLDPPMSSRTLERWETKGVPSRRQHQQHQSWLEQLAELYGVDPEQLTNGRV